MSKLGNPLDMSDLQKSAADLFEKMQNAVISPDNVKKLNAFLENVVEQGQAVANKGLGAVEKKMYEALEVGMAAAGMSKDMADSCKLVCTQVIGKVCGVAKEAIAKGGQAKDFAVGCVNKACSAIASFFSKIIDVVKGDLPAKQAIREMGTALKEFGEGLAKVAVAVKDTFVEKLGLKKGQEQETNVERLESSRAARNNEPGLGK